MKKIFRNIKLLALAATMGLGFTACDNEDYLVIEAIRPSEDINFTNQLAENYQLTEATTDNIAERFVWNQPDFGAQTPLNYVLEGSIDEEFATVDYASGSVSATNKAVTVGEILEMAELLGLDADAATTDEKGDPNNAGTVYFRVNAYVGDVEAANGVSSTSEVVAMPFVILETGEGPALMDLFLVGDATAAGWSEDNNNQPLFRDPENTSIYTFTGKFNAGYFKILEGKAWSPQWGLAADGVSLSICDGCPFNEEPGAIQIETEGYYTLTVNADDLTFTLEPFDASAAPTFDTIGIIGSATPNGWGDPDTDMTQSEFDSHLWYFNGVELIDGEMKIRANDDWNAGGNWGDTSPISGQATNDGGSPNIPVEAGTYNIWFNDLDGRYIFIPVE